MVLCNRIWSFSSILLNILLINSLFFYNIMYIYFLKKLLFICFLIFQFQWMGLFCIHSFYFPLYYIFEIHPDHPFSCSLFFSLLNVNPMWDCTASHLYQYTELMIVGWFFWLLPALGNGTPLQYFCLENPMDGGAW